MKTARTKLLARLALAAAVSVGLAACGGSSDKMDPERTPLEMAQMALMEAQETVNELATDVTDQEEREAYEDLLEAAEKVVEELGDDGAHSEVVKNKGIAEEARNKIEDIKTRLRAASDAQEAATMRMEAVDEAEDKADMLEDDRSAEAITAAKDALMTAEGAIAGSDDANAYSEKIQAAKDAIARAEALNSIEAAIMAAKKAAVALKDDSSVTAVTAAQGLIDAAEMMISDSTHLSEAEKTAYTDQVQESAQGIVDVAKADNDAAEEDRLMKQAEQNRKDKIAAAKALHGVIGAPKGAFGDNGDDDRFGGYTDAKIQVSYGDGAKSTDEPNLSLDKDTSVAPLGGWTGQRFHADGSGKTTYEAHVYSYIGKTTPGGKFGIANVGNPTRASGYTYPLNSEGFLLSVNATGTFDTNGVFVKGLGGFSGVKVELPDLGRDAGTETFELDGGSAEVEGIFHGVSGTYHCTTTGNTGTCTAEFLGEGEGFTLAGTNGTWKFKPSNPDATVTDMPDDMYASFGWWMHVKEDGTPAVASAFHDERGALDPVNSTTFTELKGSAKYNGAAVGQYALMSSTGGSNESGHFTATATLNADFGSDTADGDITGTIKDFKVGDDGDDRDWSVELKKVDFTANSGGAIPDTAMTVWTIEGDAAAAMGSWSGTLRNDTSGGDGGVPEIVTGTFYSQYGSAGKMVGAFGAKK